MLLAPAKFALSWSLTPAAATIEHDGLECWPQGEHIILRANASPAADVAKVTFHFRWDRHADWYFVPAERNPRGSWEAVLPKTASGTTGTVYFAEVLTTDFTSTRTEEYRVPVRDSCPAAPIFSGDPGTTVGQTVSNGVQVPPGFEEGGIAAFIGANGATTVVAAGGGGFGKTAAILAGVGGGAAAAAFALGGGDDPSPPPPGTSTSSVTGGGPTTTTSVGGGVTTTTSVGGGTTTTSVLGGTTTTSVFGGTTTTSILGGTTTTSTGGGTTTTSTGGGTTTTSTGGGTTTTSTGGGTTTTSTGGGTTTTSTGGGTTTTSVGSTTTSVPTTTTSVNSTTTSVNTTTTTAAGASWNVTMSAAPSTVVVNGQTNISVRMQNTGGTAVVSPIVNISFPSSFFVFSFPGCSPIGGNQFVCFPANIPVGQTTVITFSTQAQSTSGSPFNIGSVVHGSNVPSMTPSVNVTVTSSQRAGDDAPTRLAFRAFLDVEPYDGRVQAQITINRSIARTVANTGSIDLRGPARRGENTVEIPALAGDTPGFVRFDFTGSRGFVPGSLRVDLGDVYSIDGSTIAFRVGVGAPPARFTFEVE